MSDPRRAAELAAIEAVRRYMVWNDDPNSSPLHRSLLCVEMRNALAALDSLPPPPPEVAATVERSA